VQTIDVYEGVGINKHHNRMIKTSIRKADVILLAYDITRGESLWSLAFDWEKKLNINNRYQKTLLVGTKSDLAENKPSGHPIVSAEKEGRKGIDTSTKTGENVSLVFETAVNLVVEHQKSFKNENLLASTTRKTLIDDLEKYIAKIEKHADKQNNIDFKHKFRIFKDSQAANRAVNFALAYQLLEKLYDQNNSIEDVFSNIKLQREEIISAHPEIKSKFIIKNNAIRSHDLNEIIHKASAFCSHSGMVKTPSKKST
jgi:GTPase SAR1 family protein